MEGARGLHVRLTRVLQLSHRAREIFSKFLCSKATTPVNIDSQAQLADDILSAPHPDMFKEQQLQVTSCFRFPQGCGPGRGVEESGPRQWAPKYPGWEGRSRSCGRGGRNPSSPLRAGATCRCLSGRTVTRAPV